MDLDREWEGEDVSSEDSGDEAGGDDEAAALGLDQTPAEFYDPDADDRNERWLQKLRKGHKSDAILSCPLCFTTLCVDCQQHVRYEDQFRAMFVLNCRVKTDEVVRYPKRPPPRQRRKQKGQAEQQQQQQQQDAGGGAGSGPPALAAVQQQEPGAPGAAQQGGDEDRLNPVLCAVCDTEVGLRDCATGEYHLFQVVASNS